MIKQRIAQDYLFDDVTSAALSMPEQHVPIVSNVKRIYEILGGLPERFIETEVCPEFEGDPNQIILYYDEKTETFLCYDLQVVITTLYEKEFSPRFIQQIETMYPAVKEHRPKVKELEPVADT